MQNPAPITSAQIDAISEFLRATLPNTTSDVKLACAVFLKTLMESWLASPEGKEFSADAAELLEGL